MLISGNNVGPSISGPDRAGDVLFLATPFDLDQAPRALDEFAQAA